MRWILTALVLLAGLAVGLALRHGTIGACLSAWNTATSPHDVSGETTAPLARPVTTSETATGPKTPATTATPLSPAASADSAPAQRPYDPAVFAPRHARTTVDLVAFIESVEPLPPATVNQPLQRAEQISLTPAPEAVESRATAPSSPNELVPIFNGVDLNGWSVLDGAVSAWTVSGGCLRCSKPTGGWLYTVREYSDFELRFEYRLSPGANSGVGLRFPAQGSPSATGLEVQLIDDAAPKYADLRPTQQTGSLYYHVAPRQRVSQPAGEWHACRVIVLGPRVRVLINEQVVNDVQLDALRVGDQPSPLASRPPLGHVGFQSSAAPVEFRNIMIRDLLTTLPSGLQYVDIAVGTGDVCPAEGRVTMNYVGRFTDGRVFDRSSDQGASVTVSLAEVIEGWQQGVPGMKVGGRRKLIVPPRLAYGDAGVGNLIPPHATLIFEVELRAVPH